MASGARCTCAGARLGVPWIWFRRFVVAAPVSRQVALLKMGQILRLYRSPLASRPRGPSSDVTGLACFSHRRADRCRRRNKLAENHAAKEC